MPLANGLRSLGQRVYTRQMPECSQRPVDRLFWLRTGKIEFDLTRSNGLIRKSRKDIHGVVEAKPEQEALGWRRNETHHVQQPAVELWFKCAPQIHVKPVQLLRKQPPVCRNGPEGLAHKSRNRERFSELELKLKAM